jgi:Leucine Rich repeat
LHNTIRKISDSQIYNTESIINNNNNNIIMQDQVNPQVEADLQRSLASSNAQLRIQVSASVEGIALTVADARRIMEFTQENPQFNSIDIYHFNINDAAVLNVFCDGLRLCSSITKVILYGTNLTNAGLQSLRPAFRSTFITSLIFTRNNIEGQEGGEAVGHLLIGNITLAELILSYNPIGPQGVTGIGQGLAGNNHLQKLILHGCRIGNVSLANLLQSMGDTIHMALTYLYLSENNIEGADGGRHIGLLLPHFPNLKLLCLDDNNLGPLGARALALGLQAASHLEELRLYSCGIGKNGVASLVPVGQVNQSLIRLDLRRNGIQGKEGGENVVALAEHCMKLEQFFIAIALDPDQRRRLDFVLKGGNRLFTASQALGGQPFPVLFEAVEEAHRHEFGLGAIFVILQSDGDDYFCSANDCEIE